MSEPLKPVPSIQHIHTFPQQGERIVSMVQWRDMIMVATERSVYAITNGEVMDLADIRIHQVPR